jgi:hypothetical protein
MDFLLNILKILTDNFKNATVLKLNSGGYLLESTANFRPRPDNRIFKLKGASRL